MFAWLQVQTEPKPEWSCCSQRALASENGMHNVSSCFTKKDLNMLLYRVMRTLACRRLTTSRYVVTTDPPNSTFVKQTRTTKVTAHAWSYIGKKENLIQLEIFWFWSKQMFRSGKHLILSSRLYSEHFFHFSLEITLNAEMLSAVSEHVNMALNRAKCASSFVFVSVPPEFWCCLCHTLQPGAQERLSLWR